MNRRCRAALGGVLLSLCLTSVASAAFTPGSRSLGDPLLPLLGNGGYDVQHYDLNINYDPVTQTVRLNGQTFGPFPTDDFINQPQFNSFNRSGGQFQRSNAFVDREGVKLSLDLPPTVTQFRVPAGVIALGTQFKYEVIARTTTGNNTAVESCFRVQ